jgi:PASTA domain
VNLVISSGPQMVTVPNVVGLTLGAATTAITGAQLVVGTTTPQNSSTVATGNVINQDPASGSSVAQGSSVNLVISSGPQMVTVPNVVGLTLDAATTAITGAQLVVGTINYQGTQGLIGLVISQDPASGSSAAQASSVNLVISAYYGPPPPPISVRKVLRDFAEAGQYLPVIIEGENFESGAECDFGLNITTTVISVTPTELFATIQVDAGAKTGSRDVIVTQPGRQPSILPKGFRVLKFRSKTPETST